MEYRQDRDMERNRDRTRDMQDKENMNMSLNMTPDKTEGRTRMRRQIQGGARGMNPRENAEDIEEVYCELNKHMHKALSFHSQLADYFCFLGLHGFKRMLEYQYLEESECMRKMHRKYIERHHRIIPVEQVELPIFIPKDWSRYTTKDINDSVIPKFVRAALNEYRDWEEETKRCYEEQCEILKDLGAISDYEYVKDLIENAEKEIKKVNRIEQKLSGTGYDVTTIHGVQDKYHEKYKEKYNDRFTTKNNYRPFPDPFEDDMDMRRGRKRRMGFVNY